MSCGEELFQEALALRKKGTFQKGYQLLKRAAFEFEHPFALFEIYLIYDHGGWGETQDRNQLNRLGDILRHHEELNCFGFIQRVHYIRDFETAVELANTIPSIAHKVAYLGYNNGTRLAVSKQLATFSAEAGDANGLFILWKLKKKHPIELLIKASDQKHTEACRILYGRYFNEFKLRKAIELVCSNPHVFSQNMLEQWIKREMNPMVEIYYFIGRAAVLLQSELHGEILVKSANVYRQVTNNSRNSVIAWMFYSGNVLCFDVALIIGKMIYQTRETDPECWIKL